MSCCGHDTSCPLCGKLIFCGPETDSLDVAWADAEAALPEGWHLFLSSSPAAGHDAYARKPGSILPWDFTGNGPTPAAALRALAAKLRERAG